MDSPIQRLRATGIRMAVDESDEEVRTACTALAGAFLRHDCKLVGLLPAGDDVAIPAIALQLGRSLVGLTGSPVGVIDAAGTWPSLGDESSRPVDTALFATTWLEDNLAVLSPRTFDIGGMLIKIIAALEAEAAIFGSLIVDMTGFARLGEHLAAMTMVDGVVLVARSGRTTEDQLLSWMREIPRERNLGVLLVGA